MNIKQKAFVKYVPNHGPVTLLKRNKKPSGQGWIEIPMNPCCSNVSPVIIAYRVDLSDDSLRVGDTSEATAYSVTNSGTQTELSITSAVSSNTNIVTISGTTLTAVAKGVVYVTFILEDGTKFVRTIDVEAQDNY